MKKEPMNDIVIQTRGLIKEFVRDEFHVVALTTSISISAAAISWR